MITNVKTYLSITKKQWNGLVVLILLIIAVLAFKYVYQRLNKDSTINYNALAHAAALLNKAEYKRHTTHFVPYKPAFARKAPLSIPVELNSADSATLTTIYGIGPSFARRIIKYRKLLGGFYNKEQLKEVYGLDEAKYSQIKNQLRVDVSGLKKIDINSAGAEELNRLPYLDYKQANAIEQYRLQHGDYTTSAELKAIMILNEETINKIKPYLKFK